MNLSGTDSVTGGNAANSFTETLAANPANTTTAGFVDYTSANKVIYGQNADGLLTKSNVTNADKTAALVNNGIYVKGNELLLSSYLIKNVVNGKWVANINNMNSIIDGAATNLYNYRNTLTGATGTNNTILDANGKVIDAKFQEKVAGGGQLRTDGSGRHARRGNGLGSVHLLSEQLDRRDMSLFFSTGSLLRSTTLLTSDALNFRSCTKRNTAPAWSEPAGESAPPCKKCGQRRFSMISHSFRCFLLIIAFSPAISTGAKKVYNLRAMPADNSHGEGL